MSQARIWGLVLSRKGSKRLPQKACLPLQGQPMIGYTFQAAKASKKLNETWLFSDDQDAIAVAEQHGIAVPDFERPESASQDATSSEDTLRYFLQQFDLTALPELLVLLQPTSPLRSAEDIDGAIEAFQKGSAETVITVTTPPKPLQWSYIKKPDQTLEPAFPDSKADLVYPNGAIYITRPERLLAGQDLMSGRVQGYEMPWARSIDIDTPEDFQWAEMLLKQPVKS